MSAWVSSASNRTRINFLSGTPCPRVVAWWTGGQAAQRLGNELLLRPPKNLTRRDHGAVGPEHQGALSALSL